MYDSGLCMPMISALVRHDAFDSDPVVVVSGRYEDMDLPSMKYSPLL